MANPAVGRIRCPICDTDAEVRRYKGSERGKLYWACCCGQIRPALAVGQGYIERNMRALDAPPPEPRAAEEEKTARVDDAKPREQVPSPRPATQAQPAKRDAWSFLRDL